MLPSHGFGEDKMTQGKNRQWLLARRPRGAIGVDDLRLSETDIPEPGEGEILVHNIYLSCDPTQRGWMARDTYMPMIPLGEVVRSFAGGEVVRSRDPRFVGDAHFVAQLGLGATVVTVAGRALGLEEPLGLLVGLVARGRRQTVRQQDLRNQQRDKQTRERKGKSERSMHGYFRPRR